MKPRHHEHETLRFTIIHDETSNIVSGMDRTTWMSQKQRFLWEIVRPRNGTKLFSRTCPHCSKELDIQVESIEVIREYRAIARRLGPICAVLSPVVLSLIVGMMYLPDSWQHNSWLSGAFVLCIFCFIGSLAGLCSWLMPPGPGYRQASLLSELQLAPRRSPYGGHYIESAQSH